MKKLIHLITQTPSSTTSLILRLTLAVVFFPHGAQKMLGWFGGYGFEGTMTFFTQTMHIPYPFALLAVATEFFAPLALLLGLLARPAALGIGFTMVVALFMGHIQNGFFMNWSGQQAGEGFEYHLLAIGLALAVVIQGAGCCSLDKIIAKKTE